MTLRALREPDGALLIEPLHVCRTRAERMRGLLDRSSIGPAEGMWFPRCRLIHTFGMKFPIDVVYLDERLTVRKTVPGLRPARLSACLGAESVIELASGAASALGLCRGVRLRILE